MMAADTPKTKANVPSWLAPVYDKLFPDRGKLQEEHHRASWLAYLLTIVMGSSALLIFGNRDFPSIFQPDLAIKLLAGLRLSVIFFGVYVADRCLVRSYERLAALRWRGETLLYYEHWAYMLFVLAINGSTIFLVFSSSLPNLLSGHNVVPTSWLTAIEVIKAVLLAWTTFQILTTSDKLLVEWGTVLRLTAELLGGKVKEWLRSLDVDTNDPASLFAAYNATVKGLQKPRHTRRYWFNAEARHAADESREARIIAGEDARRNELITALQSFSAAKAVDMTVETERIRIEHQRKLGDALLGILTNGEIPAWVIAEYPSLASVPVARTRSGSKTTKAGATVMAMSSGNAPRSGNDELRAMLLQARIAAVNVSFKTRDIWLKGEALAVLSNGAMSERAIAETTRRLGGAKKYGTYNIFPLKPALAELANLNILIEPFLGWYRAHSGKGQEAEIGEDTTIAAQG